MSLLERWHKDLRNSQNANVRVSTGNNINQVTDGEIRRAVDAAYKSARLYEFERLAGEIWTKDRLTVRVLDYSRKELDQYFRGIGVKGTSMADLEQVFEASAKQVYANALQVAELIGVSHSFDRFIRTIYEHSDRADESLSTIGSDGRYERMVAVLVDSVPRETFINDNQALASDALGLDKQFLFRFRARRVLYDCMAARYGSLINGGSAGSQQNQLMVSNPAQTTPVASRANGTEAMAASGATSQNLWDHMGQFVSTKCREPLGGVMTEVKDGRIRPQPARWDSSGGDASLGGRPGLMPTTTLQPR